MPDNSKTVLTTGEAAKYCHVNLRTVIRWIERGKLKAYKLPGRGDNRIQVSDFIDFLQEHELPIPEPLLASQNIDGQQSNSTDAGSDKKNDTHTSNIKQNHVLIVDDEPSFAKSIFRVLKKAGYTCSMAHDGFQAGAVLALERPSVVTLDLNMPGMRGEDVVRFIRNNSEYDAVKILIISASSKDELEKAMSLGADAMLEKPFHNDVFLDRVRELMGHA